MPGPRAEPGAGVLSPLPVHGVFALRSPAARCAWSPRAVPADPRKKRFGWRGFPASRLRLEAGFGGVSDHSPRAVSLGISLG